MSVTQQIKNSFSSLSIQLFGPKVDIKSLSDVTVEDLRKMAEESDWLRYNKTVGRILEIYEKQYGVKLKYHRYGVGDPKDEGIHAKCPKCDSDINLFYGNVTKEYSVCKRCGYDIMPAEEAERSVVGRAINAWGSCFSL